MWNGDEAYIEDESDSDDWTDGEDDDSSSNNFAGDDVRSDYGGGDGNVDDARYVGLINSGRLFKTT